MKFSLSISSSYVPGWDAFAGIRELFQNAADAHDLGNEMKISHHTGTLRIVNEGVKLDPKVWLLGMTTKVGRSDQRGQFGEGFTLGILALIRQGLDVKIINDDESWTPTLEDSDVFPGEKVLTVTTRKRESSGRFCIEISPLPKETWEALKPRFLFLSKPKNVKETDYTDVILDPAYAGKLFVKGIWVANDPKLSHGYNFKDVAVDRDRKMVDRFQAEGSMGRAWATLATKTPALMKSHLMPMLEQGAPDVGDVHYYIQDHVQAALVDAFKSQYGADAMPVLNVAAAREVEHFGKRGVVQPEAMVDILAREFGTVEKLREANKDATTAIHSWADLSGDEKATWMSVLGAVEPVAAEQGYDAVEARCVIVDFRDQGLNGTYSESGIKLARKLLSNRRELIRVLAHEVAHSEGGDAEKTHEVAEGRLLAGIIDSMLP